MKTNTNTDTGTCSYHLLVSLSFRKHEQGPLFLRTRAQVASSQQFSSCGEHSGIIIAIILRCGRALHDWLQEEEAARGEQGAGAGAGAGVSSWSHTAR